MTFYRRPCSCDHAFPLCSCPEGQGWPATLARSRWLSSLAGYPARVGVTDAVAVLTRHLRPAPRDTADCGCGGRA